MNNALTAEQALAISSEAYPKVRRKELEQVLASVAQRAAEGGTALWLHVLSPDLHEPLIALGYRVEATYTGNRIRWDKFDPEPAPEPNRKWFTVPGSRV